MVQYLKKYRNSILHFVLYCILFIFYKGLKTNYNNYGYERLNLSFLNFVYLLTLEAAAFIFIPKLESEQILKKYWNKGCLFVFFIITAYAAFACVGSTLFLLGESAWNISVHKIGIFLIFMCWVVPYELLFLVLLYKVTAKLRRSKGAEEPNKALKIKVYCSLCLFMAGIWIGWLVACNPANAHVDTFAVWGEAVGDSPLTDWYPTMHTLLIRVLISIIPHLSTVVIFQIICFALVCAAFFTLFWEKGMKLSTCFLLAGFFAMLPSNGLMVTTLLSNTLYSISILWLVYLLVRIIETKKEKRLLYRLFLLGIAMLSVYFMRNEGFLIVFLICIWLFLSGVKKKKIVFLLPIALFLIVGISIKGPLYDRLGVVKNAKISSYTPVVDVVQAALYYDVEFSEETMEYLEQFASVEEWKNAYDPYYVDNGSKLYWDYVQSDRVFPNAVEAAEKGLGVALRTRLTKADLLWDVAEPVGCHTARCVKDIVENKYGFTRKENILTKLLVRLYYPATIMFCLSDILLYRSGIYIIAVMLLFLYLWREKRQKLFILYLPMLGVILSQIIAACWQGFRHIWIIFLIFWFLFGYVIWKEE